MQESLPMGEMKRPMARKVCGFVKGEMPRYAARSHWEEIAGRCRGMVSALWKVVF